MNISRTAMLLVVLAMGRVCAMERDELTYPTIEQGSPKQDAAIAPADDALQELKSGDERLYLDLQSQVSYYFPEGDVKHQYYDRLVKNLYQAGNMRDIKRLLAQIKVSTGQTNGYESDDDDACVIL